MLFFWYMVGITTGFLYVLLTLGIYKNEGILGTLAFFGLSAILGPFMIPLTLKMIDVDIERLKKNKQ